MTPKNEYFFPLYISSIFNPSHFITNCNLSQYPNNHSHFFLNDKKLVTQRCVKVGYLQLSHLHLCVELILRRC